MFETVSFFSSVITRCTNALKALAMLLLVTGMLLSLYSCTSAENKDVSDFSESQRFSVAIPLDLVGVIAAVRFEVTNAIGNTQTAVVPLIAQGLPDGVNPDLAGHRFADWFVVLNPGTYHVVATPLESDNKPSNICIAAGGTVSIFGGVTTEMVLVSNCDAQSGGLDVSLVFNHNPFIEKLVIAPNKFLCIGRHVVLTARASDADDDELSYDWQVTEKPVGTSSSDFQLNSANPPPWQAKFSASVAGRYELTLSVSDGHGSTSLSFPIYVSDCDDPEGASIHGVKWLDSNGNAERDANEPGLPGVIIYSDLNDNAVPDPGEPATRSMDDDPLTNFDESGRFWLEDLRPGRHSIREVIPDGFVQTFPSTLVDPVTGDDPGTGVTITPTAINATLAAGETQDIVVNIGFDFFCFRPFDINLVADTAPAGMVQNLTGVLQNGCGGDVSSFDVRLTGDGNVRSFELQFVDNEFGGVLGAIPVLITPPGNGSHEVLLESGDVLEGLDFGNKGRPDSASIHGRKWQDNNANGERDGDEPGLAGVIIYSDLNDNGALDQDEPRTLSMNDDPLTDFDESGLYWLEGLSPGDHIIREIVPDGFRQTFPSIPPVVGDNIGSGFDVTPDAINITLAAGTTQDTEVALTIHPFCIRPFNVDLEAPLAPAGVFQNFTGQLINGCGGDTSSFDIRLGHSGGVANFDIDFVDAKFGGVIASLPVQITEPNAGFHAIHLDAGDVVEGVDFGNVDQ